MQTQIRQDILEVIESIKKDASEFEGKTVLITGGAGFIGSYLSAIFLTMNQELFKKPCKVVVLDNFITGSKHNLLMQVEDDPNFSLLIHDITKNIPDLEADFVIHAAGLASPHYYQKFPLETIEAAVEGTRNVLEFSKEKKVRGILYFSSSEIYGDPHPDFIPTPEAYWGNVSTTGPRACYDESKRMGETLCSVYHKLYDIPIRVVRPFNVYGPGMKIDDYRVIPTFLSKGLKNEPLTVHDNGNQTRTFCYATDAMQGFLKILASGKNGEIYNVGSESGETTITDLAKTIQQLLPIKPEVNFIDYPDSYPAGEPRRRCPDLSKIKNELGYSPKVSLEEGLSRTIQWYENELKNSQA